MLRPEFVKKPVALENKKQKKNKARQNQTEKNKTS